MFDDIAKRYDFLNHFLSLGIDRSWRKTLVRLAKQKKPKTILDVATGTGDLAIALTRLNPEKIIGIDISQKMLEIGKAKIEKRGLQNLIFLKPGDAERIPFSDTSFDAVTVAFGVRNYENLQLGLSEMKRVLRPGGIMLILEFSYPSSVLFKLLYRFYSRFIIPVFGRIISSHPEAYQYLPDSVSRFPSGNDFLAFLDTLGLRNSRQTILTMGIASIYSAEK